MINSHHGRLAFVVQRNGKTLQKQLPEPNILGLAGSKVESNGVGVAESNSSESCGMHSFIHLRDRRVFPGTHNGDRLCAGLVRVLLMLAMLSTLSFADEPQKPDRTVMLTINSETHPITITGRTLVEAQDGGVLMEERNGRLRLLTTAMIVSRSESVSPFAPFSADEMATDLLAQVSTGFEVLQTEHYVICSNSSEEYAEFVGKLLEKVFDEYFKFMNQQEISVHQPAAKLPIIILQSQADLEEFASRQHPETTFEDTPGYYSIRENQTLLLDLTRDRSVRTASIIRKRLAEQPLQVATMVHEAVHQLAFNTGLQVRMADNPVWFSEGLSLYFEPIVPRASSLWTRPGLVNGRHHPEFVRRTENGRPEIPFADLLKSDNAFLEANTVAVAYAESWGLTMYLFRQQKDGLKTFLANLSQRMPLQRVSPETRLQEFEAAFGKSPDEMERDAVSFVRRLRASQ